MCVLGGGGEGIDTSMFLNSNNFDLQFDVHIVLAYCMNQSLSTQPKVNISYSTHVDL